MWVVKQGGLTFSALWKSTYYKKYGNASVLFARSVQRTKCIKLLLLKTCYSEKHWYCLLRISLEELLLSISLLYTSAKVHRNAIICVLRRLSGTRWAQVRLSFTSICNVVAWRENAQPPSRHFLNFLQLIKEPMMGMLLRCRLKSILANDIMFPTVHNLFGWPKTKPKVRKL